MSKCKQELRAFVEQEINAAAVGANRLEMPPDFGILIPSLDLQQSVDRIMNKVEAYYEHQVQGNDLVATDPKPTRTHTKSAPKKHND